jgi:hypothetical protein
MAAMYDDRFISSQLNILLVDRTDYDNRPFIASYKPGMEKYFISEVQLNKFASIIDDNSFLEFNTSSVVEARIKVFRMKILDDRNYPKNGMFKQEDDVILNGFLYPHHLYEYILKSGRTNIIKRLLNKDYLFYNYLLNLTEVYYDYQDFPELAKGNNFH